MPRTKKIESFDVPAFDREAAVKSAAAAAGLFLRRGLRRRSSPKDWYGTAMQVLRSGAVMLLWLHAAFILSSSLVLFIFRYSNPGATTLMTYRAVADGWAVARPRYLPLAKIPKAVRNMAIRVEDGSFYEHRGILPAAIKHAWKMNQQYGAPVYGGSTITMQTARTIFLIPAKNYLRKYLEVIIALEMEFILGKDRILELYFNYAEWGKGVFGIEAASRLHYKAGIAAVSTERMVRLVTLLASPIRYGPYNFNRNGILKSRYEFLADRYLR